MTQPIGLLVDFGGVLTSSVTASFEAHERSLGIEPGLLAGLLRDDAEAARMLVEHECGRLPDAAFEDGLAERAARAGVQLPARGLIAGLQAGLTPDAPMIDHVRRLHDAGTPVAVVSNALGANCYDGYDLRSLSDVIVLSNELGVRKPSRAIYAKAAVELGLEPSQCVLVDDVQHNLDGAARLGVTGVLHVSATSTIAELDVLGLHAKIPNGVP